MGAILQHPCFYHRDMDQLTDQEEEATSFAKKGIQGFLPLSSVSLTHYSTMVTTDEVLQAGAQNTPSAITRDTMMIGVCN